MLTEALIGLCAVLVVLLAVVTYLRHGWKSACRSLERQLTAKDAKIDELQIMINTLDSARVGAINETRRAQARLTHISGELDKIRNR